VRYFGEYCCWKPLAVKRRVPDRFTQLRAMPSVAAHEEMFSAAWIAHAYGAFVPAAHVAKLLGFPTTTALRRAKATGRLALPLFKLKGRRGLFADAVAVANYLRVNRPPSAEGSP